jgi:Uma2 family endonuclease
MTFEEYMVCEELNEIRHEFYKGEVFAMAGASKVHNIIIMNFSSFWNKQIRKRGCHLYAENVKLELIKNQYYVYPDLMMTCTSFDLQAKLIVKSPSLIIEVLSPSTSQYDRTIKMNYYLKLPSLQYYLLVDSEKQFVECWERASEDGVKWTYTRYSEAAEIISLSLLDLEIPVSEVYDGVSFEEEEL